MENLCSDSRDPRSSMDPRKLPQLPRNSRSFYRGPKVQLNFCIEHPPKSHRQKRQKSHLPFIHTGMFLFYLFGACQKVISITPLTLVIAI